MNNCKKCKNANVSETESLPSGAVCWCKKLKTYISIPNFRCSEFEINSSEKRNGLCPVCGSDKINFGDIDFASEKEVYQECWCGECESEFNDRYEYFETEITYNPGEKK